MLGITSHVHIKIPNTGLLKCSLSLGISRISETPVNTTNLTQNGTFIRHKQITSTPETFTINTKAWEDFLQSWSCRIKRSLGTCNAKLKITINRLSIERTDEEEPMLHSTAAHKPSTKSKPSYTAVECTLPSTNKYQPKELFSVANTVQKNRAMQPETYD